jgi:hypothetical protein
MADYSGLTSKAVSGLFYEAYDAAKWKTFHNLIAYLNADSVQDIEIYRNPVASGGMELFDGEIKLENGEILEYQLRNQEYGVAMELDKRQMQFDRTGSLRMTIADLANNAAQHPNILLSTMINNGDAAASIGQDGFVFFATNHLKVKSGTQSNKITFTAAVPSAPTSTELSTGVMKALMTLRKQKNESGYPTNMDANSFVFMYPDEWAEAAVSAVGVDLLATGGTLQRNVVEALQREGVPNFERITILPRHNPMLNSAIKGYLFRTDGNIVRPFVWQERVPTTLEELLEGSESSVRRNKHVFAIKANRAAGYMQWRHAVQFTATAP